MPLISDLPSASVDSNAELVGNVTSGGTSTTSRFAISSLTNYISNAIPRPLVLTSTLEAGETTVTFENAEITDSKMIDIYTDVFGVNPTNAIVGGHILTLTFDSRDSDLGVKVRIE